MSDPVPTPGVVISTLIFPYSFGYPINNGVDLGDTYTNGTDPTSSWPDGVTTLDQDDEGSGWEIGCFVYDE